MTTKRGTRMFLVAILAMVAATVVSALSLQAADADSAGTRTCSGDPIKLTNAEERVLRLHNRRAWIKGSLRAARPDQGRPRPLTGDAR